MAFPQNFSWGVATSAYQIEGATAADGRGPSIWDEFCKKSGAIHAGHTAQSACDHYNRSDEDVGLMRKLGIRAYRFSVAWPRILPHGTGTVNPRGLDFYDRLVDSLLAAGITPWITLFHWDYPLDLHLRGGWLNPDSAGWFADYAAVVTDRLSDRVVCWFTINEPQVYVGLGYQQGIHAPGLRLPFDKVLRVGHNLLRGHGMAVQAIRNRAKKTPMIGYALATNPVPIPATGYPADKEASRSMLFGITRKDCMNSVWWADPIVLGTYPDDGLRLFAPDLPKFPVDDIQVISRPIDFIGLNVYFGEIYRAGPTGEPCRVALPAEHRRTGFGWPVMPECLYWAPKFFTERYGLPVVISENGAAYPDVVQADKRVRDPKRIRFLCEYLLCLQRLCAEGGRVLGYFLWSLLDNFEWTAGYSQRFGIVHVNFSTQERTPKDSAWWYRDVILSGGRTLSEGTEG